jgi:transcription factor E
MLFFFNISMLKKFLTEVMISIVGKLGEELVELLDGKKYTNEFIIAKKLDLTINQTRNILYKISDHGLVSSIRKKDKKKGWYTYFWKIEILKSLTFLEKILSKKINEINYQIKSRTEKQFYTCKRCNIEITEEKALTHNFICNECGEVFGLKENSIVIRMLEKEKNKGERQLKLVDEEIQKEKEKLEKSKIRKIKKEEKEKIEKRRIKRELTKQKKQEEAKKLIKKGAKTTKSKVSKKKIKPKNKKVEKKKIKPKNKKVEKKKIPSKSKNKK